jgi:hypothetical protein
MMVGKGINDIDVDIPSDAYDTGKDMPTFKAYLIAVVRDSTGKVIKVHKQRSRSPTANFIGLLLPLTWFNYTGSSITITTVNGGTCSYRPGMGASSQDISYPSNNPNAMNPTYLVMIQVGNGSQPNPSSATKLAAPIPNGTGSGQLIYGSVSIPGNVSVSGSSVYFQISQAYSNQSGATIDITEVGVVLQLIIQNYYNTSSTNCGQVLVWYDVLSSAISIPNGGTLVIYYTFIVNP